MTANLTTDELQTWLEWAGLRLVAITVRGTKPAGFRVAWPDFAQDKWEVTNFRAATAIRIPSPPPNEVTIMDSILRLPDFCRVFGVRRVIQYRALIHPISGRHIQSWDKIAAKLSTDKRTVRRWHEKGLEEIIEKAPDCKLAPLIEQLQGLVA